MKKARTFIKKAAELKYDLVAATKEIYHAITSITKDSGISLSEYRKKGVCESPHSPYGGFVSKVYRPQGSESIIFLVWGTRGYSDNDIYDFPVAEMIDVYEQLEKIYQYEKKENPLS